MKRLKQKTLNQEKRQFFYGLGLLVLVLMIGVFLFAFSSLSAFYWLSGIGLGYLLQRSRFCFTAALRDPYLTGSTALSRAVLVALFVTTLGFSLINYYFLMNGQAMPGQAFIQAIGLNTIVGGLVFGIGMVLASSCASGLFTRIGEGFSIQLLTLLFFFIGHFLASLNGDWWQSHFILSPEGIFLPDVLTWPGALMIQLFFILVLYVWAIKWEENHED